VTRTEVVVSELLTAHPVVPPQIGAPLLRALGLAERESADEKTAADYAASLAAGFVEELDAFSTRLTNITRGTR
jgi:hypothetical protein